MLNISKYNKYYFIAGLTLWAVVFLLNKASASNDQWLLVFGLVLVIPYGMEKVKDRIKPK